MHTATIVHTKAPFGHVCSQRHLPRLGFIRTLLQFPLLAQARGIVLTRLAQTLQPTTLQVINQLLLGTDWGELEYLIIDMPPGTI